MLVTLLNNLKVQERQNRVCTTVAIAIVAETCAPFTVLPALMNEYRTPEINVQNGVLKALSFMFEYIGEMAKDYIYAVTPLLEDALMDRDLVGRGGTGGGRVGIGLGNFREQGLRAGLKDLCEMTRKSGDRPRPIFHAVPTPPVSPSRPAAPPPPYRCTVRPLPPWCSTSPWAWPD